MSCDLLKQRDLIEEFLNKRPRQLSAFSFINIFTWRDFFDFAAELINGNLCIFAKDSLGCFMYLPPLGENIREDTIEECFRLMNSQNQGSGISRIENLEEDDMPFFRSSGLSCFKKSDEYVYRREDMVSLKGNSFKSKRSSYNYFVKNYPYDFLPFKEDMRKECETLYDTWAQGRLQVHRNEVYREMLEESRFVHRLALKEYKVLRLTGRVITIDGKIKAYSFGFPLNQDTFCILFEVADLNIKGLSMGIFREFCADCEIQNFQFINVMDDFGLENIKATKLSFRPYQTLPSYVVSKKDKNEISP